MKNSVKTVIILAIMLIALGSCSRKPHAVDYGYFRIEIPSAKYQTFSKNIPYSCEISAYAEAQPVPESKQWFNIFYPQFNATIHCSYKSLKHIELDSIIEETRNLVYKHTIRADAISETYFENNEHKTYGVLYEISGNAASSAQFFLTDSIHHFVRGSLYFNNLPNADSIAPVNAFIVDDMRHMMETLVWVEK